MKTVLMGNEEVAARLGLTVKQLAWQVAAKRAPKHALIAGRRMWREVDVEAYIAEAFENAS